MGDQPTGRVLFFGPAFHEVGGAQKRARLLTSGLANSGWTVRAVNRAGTRRSFAITSKAGLRGLDVPGFRVQGLGAALYLALSCVIGVASGRAVSVIVAMQVGSQTVAAAIVGMILRKPFVVLTTSSGMLSEVGILREGHASIVRRWAIRRASHVVVQTQAAVNEFDGLCDPDRVRVMANPVELVGEVPLNGLPRAVFVGRLSMEKDLPILLAAWGHVVVGRRDARLTILGSGGHFRSVEPLLLQMIDQDPTLRHSVDMKGWVTDPLPYLQAADVFVLPSLSEGMSNSLLEACAAARVVVATAVPSNIAILGSDYPLLFSPGDVDALRQTLNLAFDDEDKRREAVDDIKARRHLFSTERALEVFTEILLEATN